MITFQQTFYKIQSVIITVTIAATVGATLVVAPVAAAQTLQIDAPPEIANHIAAYSAEINVQNQNATLRATTTTLKLIKNGKTVNEVKIDPTIPKNIALQNAVHEIFGLPTEKTSNFSGPLKTILIGTGFVAAGVLLYYSNTPKPVEKQ